MKKFFAAAMATLTMATAAVSCQEDAMDDMKLEPAAKSNTTGNDSQSPGPGCPTTVLSFQDFLHEGDVTIYDADTTAILVNRVYADVQGKKLEEGRPIVVWRSGKELPFPAIVSGTEEFGSDMLKVSISPADIADVLPGGNYELSSDLYVNPYEAPRTNDGSINDLYYKEQRGLKSIYHPVAVIPAAENKTNAAQGKCLLTMADELGPVMIEDLARSNFDFDASLLTINTSVEDLGFKFENEDNGGSCFLGFKELSMDCSLGFGMVLDTDVETSWWPPFIKGISVNEFQAYERADVSMSYDFRIEGEYSFGQDDPSEFEICKLGSYASVFMVGIVPVAITADASMVASNLFEGSVSGTMGYRGSLEYHQKSGAQYKNRQWNRIKGDDSPATSGQPYVQGSIDLKDELGIFIKLDTKLYGVVGPTLAMGPSIVVEANATASAQMGDDNEFDALFEASVAADLDLSAKASIEVKVMKWNLLKASVEIPICSQPLFDYAGLYSFMEKKWYTNEEVEDWKEEHGYN